MFNIKKLPIVHYNDKDEVVRKVVFKGVSDEQIELGNKDNECLEVGKVYQLMRIRLYKYHTTFELSGEDGSFNGDSFDYVDGKGE